MGLTSMVDIPIKVSQFMKGVVRSFDLAQMDELFADLQLRTWLMYETSQSQEIWKSHGPTHS